MAGGDDLAVHAAAFPCVISRQLVCPLRLHWLEGLGLATTRREWPSCSFSPRGVPRQRGRGGGPQALGVLPGPVRWKSSLSERSMCPEAT